jgi:two-component system OmpR family sensor kinase
VLLSRIHLLIIGAGIAILIAVVATDVMLTGRVLRPIDAIVQQARRLSESTLAERLPQPKEPGELARLVETLNEMLLRLHQSFEAQRRFTADAAHELRSPLTRMRTEMEVTLRRPRDVEEYRLIVVNALEEIERLGGLTENLLALARLDAGEGRQLAGGETRLADAIEMLVVRFQSLATGRGVSLHVERQVVEVAVKVLPAIVDVVLGNVVDNAVKFARPGGVVTLDVMATSNEGIVTVTDTGPGIPIEEQPHVFERFFRGRAPRASGAFGVGLGLAIARTLVERQNGAIDIDSKPGYGTIVTIRLPLAVSNTR